MNKPTIEQALTFKKLSAEWKANRVPGHVTRACLETAHWDAIKAKEVFDKRWQRPRSNCGRWGYDYSRPLSFVPAVTCSGEEAYLHLNGDTSHRRLYDSVIEKRGVYHLESDNNGHTVLMCDNVVPEGIPREWEGLPVQVRNAGIIWAGA